MMEIVRDFLLTPKEDLEESIDKLDGLDNDVRKGLITLKYFSEEWTVCGGCSHRVIIYDMRSDYIAEINTQEMTFKLYSEAGEYGESESNSMSISWLDRIMYRIVPRTLNKVESEITIMLTLVGLMALVSVVVSVIRLVKSLL